MWVFVFLFIPSPNSLQGYDVVENLEFGRTFLLTQEYVFIKARYEGIAAEEVMTAFVFMCFGCFRKMLEFGNTCNFYTLQLFGIKDLASSDHCHQKKGRFSTVSRILWPVMIQTKRRECNFLFVYGWARVC